MPKYKAMYTKSLFLRALTVTIDGRGSNAKKWFFCWAQYLKSAMADFLVLGINKQQNALLIVKHFRQFLNNFYYASLF